MKNLKLALIGLFFATSISTLQANECVHDQSSEQVVVSCDNSQDPGFCIVSEIGQPQIEYDSVCINQ